MTYFSTACQVFLALYGLVKITVGFSSEEPFDIWFGLVVSALAIAALIV